MITQKTLLSLLVVLAAAGSAVLIWRTQPETIRAASADGRLFIEGVGAAPMDWRVVRRDDLSGPFTAALAPVYDLGDGVSSTQPLRLRLTSDAFAQDASDAALVRFDPSISAWRFVPAFYDATTMTLEAQIDRASGLWAAAHRVSDAIPETANDLRNELLSFPPEDAVGYRLSALSASAPGDFVLLEETRERGGCDGVFRSGTSQTQTSSDRRVGDRVYRLLVRWELGEGCPVSVPLRAQAH